MHNHSLNLAKSFANWLAQTISPEDNVQVLRMMRRVGLLAQPEDRVAAGESVKHPDEGRENNQVGIWERKSGSNSFVRRLDMADQWNWWANVGRIGPKQAKHRVVLIGESVARGYLYDPQFNPAKALDGIFRSQLGPGEIEVVDLAKTGMNYDEVRSVAASASLLEPDCVVIFAGNNWALDGIQGLGSDAIVALSEQGTLGLKRLAERKMAERCRSVAGEIGGYMAARRLPLVWMIPEFNLGDWRDPVMNAPYLIEGTNWDWIHCYKRATEALERGDYDTASVLAKKIVELDGGTCAAGFYVMADCAQNAGNTRELRSCLEAARDVIMGRPSITPRQHAVTQRVLREEIARHGMQCVDLPKLFAEYLDGGLPDRRLFLDYCHLTAEGIQIAMRAAASCVVLALKRPALPSFTQNNLETEPSSQSQGEAMFLAAVYNAHLHQSRDLIDFFCRQSLRLAPNMAEVMACFADFQTRRNPMLMCKSAEQLADGRFPSVQKYLLRFNLHLHQMDRTLLEAIVAALRDVDVDYGGQMECLRAQERSVAGGRVDLLDQYYISSVPQEFAQPLDDADDRTESRNDYHKAYSPESKFIFVGDADHPVVLDLACRLPGLGPDHGCVLIELNGELQGEAQVSQEWRSYEISVRTGVVKNGVNEVVIRWPAGEIPGRRGLDAAVQDMLGDLVPDLHPVFGEIHSFTAAVPGNSEEAERHYSLPNKRVLP